MLDQASGRRPRPALPIGLGRGWRAGGSGCPFLHPPCILHPCRRFHKSRIKSRILGLVRAANGLRRVPVAGQLTHEALPFGGWRGHRAGWYIGQIREGLVGRTGRVGIITGAPAQERAQEGSGEAEARVEGGGVLVRRLPVIRLAL
ncbi:hypothetical protein DF3PB_1670002 [uncultured Defluviicoccus sp.]|uniref:Uncharacterized protein n=1 Tax=metagenome TaxID=256318 RepID=A0A380TC23_9ZZZZ|nr:hypothetical protein DF3PB_1670002 [uncultured Defluviicoccus sp.]